MLTVLVPHPSSSALAQVPNQINYQGRLVDGTNLVNGSVGMSLKLYNVASGGTALYEDFSLVNVVDGLYSTFIGDNTVSGSLTNALTNSSVYVEVVVNSNTLTPRERLASVAYALRAGNAGIQPPIDITASNYPVGDDFWGAVMRIANNGGGPAIVGEATNASGLAAINWGNGNALFVANAGSGPSAIFLGGNVGVGTQTPGDKLSVNGKILSTSGGYRFPDGTDQETAAINTWSVNESGDVHVSGRNVGVGTASPANLLHLNSDFEVPAVQFQAMRTSSGVSNTFFVATNVTLTVSQNGDANTASWTGLGNVLTNDNAFANIQLTVQNGTNTTANHTKRTFYAKSLKFTNLGLNLPTNVVITKLFITYTYRTSITNPCNTTSLFGDGQWIHNDLAIGGESLFSLGFSTNYTGAKATNSLSRTVFSLTPEVVNSPSFGFSLVPQFEIYNYFPDAWGYHDYYACNPVGIPAIAIDQVRVRVEYRLQSAFTTDNAINYVMGVPSDSPSFFIQPGTAPRTNGVFGIRVETNGYVYINTLNPSDRNSKENFTPVDTSDVLSKVVALPITQWSFKEEPGIRHIGPMAQDFHSAFGLGPNATSIATVDEVGVALAAIQALAKEKEALKEQVSELEGENRALREEMDAIKKKLGM